MNRPTNEAKKFMDNWLETKEENKMKKEEVKALLDKMMEVDMALYEKILDTPGFAFAFNELAKMALIGAFKEVTEEWIEEKATELDHLIADGHLNYHHQCKDFIRLLVEEIRGRSKD